MTSAAPGSAATATRLDALDAARGAALIAMAVFHFVFDLELFGWLAPGTSTSGGWRLLAIMTAGSFLFLAGVSLWMAHGERARWAGFGRRLAKVAGAAALVTGATFAAFPEAFVFFGILHCIALASLIGMALLRVPAAALLALAALAFAAPWVARADIFDPAWLWWTGLQTVPVRSVDYVPLAPWLGPFLLGLAAGRLGSRLGLWARLAAWRGAPALVWAGRRSLVIYLLHQPILIALVGGATWVLR